MSKQRLDLYLVENNYFQSREQAKRHIMAKCVYVNDEPIIKPGSIVDLNKPINIRIKTKCPFVSRAGLKLLKAIEYFKLDLTNKIMLDVGSSTGGFCDCALQHGIKQVYALDVGTNQLAYKIRTNPQVLVFEQTNFRTIPHDFFNVKFDIISMDVSFISSLLLIDNVYQFLKKDGVFILLIKPQFEAERSVKRNKKGVIEDLNIVNEVKNNVINQIKAKGFECVDCINSPILGSNGNHEFLALFTKKA